MIETFKKECIGYLPSEENPDICTHYRMGLCAFFECNDAPINCDDVEFKLKNYE